MWGGFALAGEEVWGATQEGVVHYDGTGWQLYRNALATDKPASIIADRTHVWVTDDDGNLSSFDGSRWTIRSLKRELPGISWGGDMSFRRPALALGKTERSGFSGRGCGIWTMASGMRCVPIAAREKMPYSPALLPTHFGLLREPS